MDLRDCTVLIPARTGSKRIPNKNFKPLHPDGRCATQLAIDCALHAGFRNIVVSTDQPPPFIAAVQWDRRPDRLAQDDTPMIETVQYLLENYNNRCYMLVQPTQPLRRARDLWTAVELLTNVRGYYTSVVSIGLDRFVRDGTVYLFWRETVTQFGTIYGEHVRLLPIPAEHTCPLDSPEDWREAERRLRT